MDVSSHKNINIKTRSVLRIPDDKGTSHTNSVLTQKRRQVLVEKIYRKWVYLGHRQWITCFLLHQLNSYLSKKFLH